MHEREAPSSSTNRSRRNGTLDRGLNSQHAGVVVRADEGGVKPRLSLYSISKLKIIVGGKRMSSTVNLLSKETTSK